MDYGALAELIVFTLLALSILTVAVGFSVRVFLGPVIRDIVAHLNRGDGVERAKATARLEMVEERLESIERGLERLLAAQSFDRQLGGRQDRE